MGDQDGNKAADEVRVVVINAHAAAPSSGVDESSVEGETARPISPTSEGAEREGKPDANFNDERDHEGEAF